jgi:hypothetical protein
LSISEALGLQWADAEYDRNVRTTLGIYSHAVDSNRLAAQGQFLNTLLPRNQIQ